jgi:anti-anti-sigma regulatory factor
VHDEGGATLKRAKLVIELDPQSGGVCLAGEIDFAVVPDARAELAARLHTASARLVDVSGLTVLTGAGAVLIEELLDDGVTVRCAINSPVGETLRDLDLADRVHLVEVPHPRGVGS